MIKKEHRLIAEKWAIKYCLDPDLVEAIIMQESSDRPNVTRYEEGFYKTYTEPMDFSEEEEKARATSFGLMQIMGQVAREYGFKEDFRELFNPDLNIQLGCRHLSNKIKRYGRVDKGVAAYNAGSARYNKLKTAFVNQGYVDSIMNYLKQIKAGK